MIPNRMWSGLDFVSIRIHQINKAKLKIFQGKTNRELFISMGENFLFGSGVGKFIYVCINGLLLFLSAFSYRTCVRIYQHFIALIWADNKIPISMKRNKNTYTRQTRGTMAGSEFRWLGCWIVKSIREGADGRRHLLGNRKPN